MYAETVPLHEDQQLGIRRIETKPLATDLNNMLTHRSGKSALAQDLRQKGLQVAFRRRQRRVAIDEQRSQRRDAGTTTRREFEEATQHTVDGRKSRNECSLESRLEHVSTNNRPKINQCSRCIRREHAVHRACVVPS